MAKELEEDIKMRCNNAITIVSIFKVSRGNKLVHFSRNLLKEESLDFNFNPLIHNDIYLKEMLFILCKRVKESRMKSVLVISCMRVEPLKRLIRNRNHKNHFFFIYNFILRVQSSFQEEVSCYVTFV